MTNAIATKRYQVQTQKGSAWEHADTSDDIDQALRALRTAKRFGYVARVIDTLDGAVVS